MLYQTGLMMNYKEFISNSKSMLIAPAGHGKTHLITECLVHTEGKQLILTHTHAGVASIAEKIKKAQLPSDKFHIETITGYAQKYLQAYYRGTDVPDREDTELYYSFLIEKVDKIFVSVFIIKMIRATYTGLFVDEYQDCTLEQHKLITTLSNILPTRILGDPLQGIFNFNDGDLMVDLNDANHMGEFHQNIYRLVEPWRWKGLNEPLGKALNEIRTEMESHNSIDFNKYPSIELVTITSEYDLYNPGMQYYKNVNKIVQQKNVLIIYPESSSIHPRKKIIKGFKTPITLVEAIDDKDFYKIAKSFDDVNNTTIENIIYNTALALFNKTEVNKWINENGAKSRTKEWMQTSLAIKQIFTQIHDNQTLLHSAKLLKYLSTIKEIRCYRKELLNSLCVALQEAQHNNKSVYDSMIEKRNHTRRIGRKIYGRCIGTTLLTKGLEFETVVILNAHKFTCPKNLYVALTRASKRLIVFSTKSTLTLQY